MSGWTCSSCGDRNQDWDAACQCELDREDHKIAVRKIIISKLDHLSPRERRERLARILG